MQNYHDVSTKFGAHIKEYTLLRDAKMVRLWALQAELTALQKDVAQLQRNIQKLSAAKDGLDAYLDADWVDGRIPTGRPTLDTIVAEELLEATQPQVGTPVGIIAGIGKGDSKFVRIGPVK